MDQYTADDKINAYQSICYNMYKYMQHLVNKILSFIYTCTLYDYILYLYISDSKWIKIPILLCKYMVTKFVLISTYTCIYYISLILIEIINSAMFVIFYSCLIITFIILTWVLVNMKQLICNPEL